MQTFADLIRLADSQPTHYFVAVEKMQVQDPERYERFVEYLRKGMSKISKVERRHSSITALLRCDIDALIAKRQKPGP